MINDISMIIRNKIKQEQNPEYQLYQINEIYHLSRLSDLNYMHPGVKLNFFPTDFALTWGEFTHEQQTELLDLSKKYALSPPLVDFLIKSKKYHHINLSNICINDSLMTALEQISNPNEVRHIIKSAKITKFAHLSKLHALGFDLSKCTVEISNTDDFKKFAKFLKQNPNTITKIKVYAASDLNTYLQKGIDLSQCVFAFNSNWGPRAEGCVNLFNFIIQHGIPFQLLNFSKKNTQDLLSAFGKDNPIKKKDVLFLMIENNVDFNETKIDIDFSTFSNEEIKRLPENFLKNTVLTNEKQVSFALDNNFILDEANIANLQFEDPKILAGVLSRGLNAIPSPKLSFQQEGNITTYDFQNIPLATNIITPRQYRQLLMAGTKQNIPTLILSVANKPIHEMNDDEVYQFYDYLNKVYNDDSFSELSNIAQNRLKTDRLILQKAFKSAMHYDDLQQLLSTSKEHRQKKLGEFAWSKLRLRHDLRTLFRKVNEGRFLSEVGMNDLDKIIKKRQTRVEKKQRDTILESQDRSNYLSIVCSWYLCRAGYDLKGLHIPPELEVIGKQDDYGMEGIDFSSANISDILFLNNQAYYIPDIIEALSQGRYEQYPEATIIQAVKYSAEFNQKIKEAYIKFNHDHAHGGPAVSAETLNFIERFGKECRSQSLHDPSNKEFSSQNEQAVEKLQFEWIEFFDKHPNDLEELRKAPALSVKGTMTKFEDIDPSTTFNYCSGLTGENMEAYAIAFKQRYGNGVPENPFQKYITPVEQDNSKVLHFQSDRFRVAKKVNNKWNELSLPQLGENIIMIQKK